MYALNSIDDDVIAAAAADVGCATVASHVRETYTCSSRSLHYIPPNVVEIYSSELGLIVNLM